MSLHLKHIKLERMKRATSEMQIDKGDRPYNWTQGESYWNHWSLQSTLIAEDNTELIDAVKREKHINYMPVVSMWVTSMHEQSWCNLGKDWMHFILD